MVAKEVVESWKKSRADVFWGEIAPCEHVVQIYDNDDVFVSALAGFVGDGINSGDCCIIIATQAHLKALETRLRNHGIQVQNLISENRYFPLDAEEVLAKFMVNDWPDEKLFNKTISELISMSNANNRKLRAFGEMVAILWAQGHSGATVQLEHLWNKFCQQQSFCLFCAYPKSGFTNDINSSLDHICSSHSKMISGTHGHITEITYRDIARA